MLNEIYFDVTRAIFHFFRHFSPTSNKIIFIISLIPFNARITFEKRRKMSYKTTENPSTIPFGKNQLKIAEVTYKNEFHSVHHLIGIFMPFQYISS